MSLFKKIFSRNRFYSSKYWENRYKSGGNSGSGSYSNLAIFKAEIINSFVEQHKIKRVIEFGCGDGNQLSLGEYTYYTGLDVSKSAIKLCIERFRDDKNKSFFRYNSKNTNQIINSACYDLALSLDVIYHLTEDEIFESYMMDLFNSSSKYVIIYSSNFDDQIIPHVKHRRFTDWIKNNLHLWKLIETIENKYPYSSEKPDNTSYADFFIYTKEKT